MGSEMCIRDRVRFALVDRAFETGPETGPANHARVVVVHRNRQRAFRVSLPDDVRVQHADHLSRRRQRERGRSVVKARGSASAGSAVAEASAASAAGAPARGGDAELGSGDSVRRTPTSRGVVVEGYGGREHAVRGEPEVGARAGRSQDFFLRFLSFSSSLFVPLRALARRTRARVPPAPDARAFRRACLLYTSPSPRD